VHPRPSVGIRQRTSVPKLASTSKPAAQSQHPHKDDAGYACSWIDNASEADGMRARSCPSSCGARPTCIPRLKLLSAGHELVDLPVHAGQMCTIPRAAVLAETEINQDTVVDDATPTAVGQAKLSPRFGSPRSSEASGDKAAELLAALVDGCSAWKARQAQSVAAHLARRKKSNAKAETARLPPKRPNPLLRSRSSSLTGGPTRVNSCRLGRLDGVVTSQATADICDLGVTITDLHSPLTGNPENSWRSCEAEDSVQPVLESSQMSYRMFQFTDSDSDSSSVAGSPRRRVAALCDKADLLVRSMSAFIHTPPVPPPTSLAFKSPGRMRNSTNSTAYESSPEYDGSSVADASVLDSACSHTPNTSRVVLTPDAGTLDEIAELKNRVSKIEGMLKSGLDAAHHDTSQQTQIDELKKDVEATRFEMKEMLEQMKETRMQFNMISQFAGTSTADAIDNIALKGDCTVEAADASRRKPEADSRRVAPTVDFAKPVRLYSAPTLSNIGQSGRPESAGRIRVFAASPMTSPVMSSARSDTPVRLPCSPRPFESQLVTASPAARVTYPPQPQPQQQPMRQQYHSQQMCATPRRQASMPSAVPSQMVPHQVQVSTTPRVVMRALASKSTVPPQFCYRSLTSPLLTPAARR